MRCEMFLILSVENVPVDDAESTTAVEVEYLQITPPFQTKVDYSKIMQKYELSRQTHHTGAL